MLIRADFRPEHLKTYGEPEFYVQAEWFADRDRRVEGGYGKTIAEAADACRAALEARA